MAEQPLVGQGLLWMSAQPDRDLYLTTHPTFTTDKHPCPWRDSNPQSQRASDRPQTHALTGAATGIGKITITQLKNCYKKLTLIGRILFKLSSFTNSARQSHSSSPTKQIKTLQCNHEPIQLRLPTSGWLMAYTYGSSLPLRKSQNVFVELHYRKVSGSKPIIVSSSFGVHD
jgi:hypothetical protein